jgi:hypothetical protein
MIEMLKPELLHKPLDLQYHYDMNVEQLAYFWAKNSGSSPKG